MGFNRVIVLGLTVTRLSEKAWIGSPEMEKTGGQVVAGSKGAEQGAKVAEAIG